MHRSSSDRLTTVITARVPLTMVRRSGHGASRQEGRSGSMHKLGEAWIRNSGSSYSARDLTLDRAVRESGWSKLLRAAKDPLLAALLASRWRRGVRVEC